MYTYLFVETLFESFLGVDFIVLQGEKRDEVQTFN